MEETVTLLRAALFLDLSHSRRRWKALVPDLKFQVPIATQTSSIPHTSLWLQSGTAYNTV